MDNLEEKFGLADRHVLVTGANGRIGIAICELLSSLRCNLIIVDLDENNLKNLTSSLTSKFGNEIDYRVCDLEIESERNSLLGFVKENYEQLNAVINNAAFVGKSNLKGWSTKFSEQSLETWRRAIEVNLTSIFHLCQGLFPILEHSTGASIVNIASIYGMYGPDWRLYQNTSMGNPAAYAASKGGLIQLTRWLSTTIAPNIRVNSVAPGGILADQPESFIQEYVGRVPLKRMTMPDDVANAVVFLASDFSKYITGEIISVDGGWGIW